MFASKQGDEDLSDDLLFAQYDRADVVLEALQGCGRSRIHTDAIVAIRALRWRFRLADRQSQGRQGSGGQRNGHRKCVSEAFEIFETPSEFFIGGDL